MKKENTAKAEKEAPKKAATKKVAPKKETAPKKEATPKKEAAKEAPKKEENAGPKAYHVSKREDGKWQVKLAGGKIAIKLFDTKAEALEYTLKMSENQKAAVRFHASKGANKGKIRKI